MVASIYTTVVVAVERYYAVTRPISAFVDDSGGKWEKVLVFIIPVLIFSIIFNLPTFFEFRVETMSTPPATCIDPVKEINIRMVNKSGKSKRIEFFYYTQNLDVLNLEVFHNHILFSRRSFGHFTKYEQIS